MCGLGRGTEGSPGRGWGVRRRGGLEPRGGGGGGPGVLGTGVRVGIGRVGGFAGRLRKPAGEVGPEARRCPGRLQVRREMRTGPLP